MASTDPYGTPGARPDGPTGVRHGVRPGGRPGEESPGAPLGAAGGAEPAGAGTGAVEPGGVPPPETPPGESSVTADLALSAPEENVRGWAAAPTVLILASAFVVALGLVAMAVLWIVN